MESDRLPAYVPCSWSDERLSLRYEIPKIWTQKSSRRFGIYWSDKLDYGRLWPDPTDAELAAFYDVPEYKDYLAGKRRTSAPYRSAFLSRLIVKIAYLADRGVNDPLPTIKHLVQRDRFSACDIGCGSGAFLARLRAVGAVVAGVDPSPVSLAALRSTGIESHEGTAERLPSSIEGRKFDVVTMFHSLEHCRDPSAAVASAKSIMAPNGILVIEVPNMESIGFQTYAQCWWHTDAGRHLHFLTQRSVELLIRKQGLEPIKCEFQGFVAEFTPRWIDVMGQAWDSIFAGNSYTDKPWRPSLLRSAVYLPRAAVSRPQLKYEVVRVYARPI